MKLYKMKKKEMKQKKLIDKEKTKEAFRKL